MAHFAKIENNVVTNLIVVNNDVLGLEYPASEPIGQAFIASLGYEGIWLQCSYNNNFRRHHAGIGATYDETKDEFVLPKPYPSWTLDEHNDWQPPIAQPEGNYGWIESSQSWIDLGEPNDTFAG